MAHAKGGHNKKGKRGAPVRSVIKSIEPKYFDFLSLANSIGAGATLFGVGGVPQGSAQSNRIGDFISVRRLYLNYSLYIANADIVTTVRIILFRWIPNSGLLLPTVAALLEAPSSSNVLSHYNFQNQQNYEVMWEKQFRAVGTATNPTTASNFGATGLSLPVGRNPDQEYGLGATSGSNQLFFLAISDSALTPFPIWNYSLRTYYEDTIRHKNKGMVK
jgi:hypothetical protein